jgi:hypothetical protein
MAKTGQVVPGSEEVLAVEAVSMLSCPGWHGLRRGRHISGRSGGGRGTQPRIRNLTRLQPVPLGGTPWDVRRPIALDTSSAQRLGYAPVGDYAATVAAEVEWFVAAAQGRAGADTGPADDGSFFASYLDYAAEDAYLAHARHG